MPLKHNPLTIEKRGISFDVKSDEKTKVSGGLDNVEHVAEKGLGVLARFSPAAIAGVIAGVVVLLIIIIIVTVVGSKSANLTDLQMMAMPQTQGAFIYQPQPAMVI